MTCGDATAAQVESNIDEGMVQSAEFKLGSAVNGSFVKIDSKLDILAQNTPASSQFDLVEDGRFRLVGLGGCYHSDELDAVCLRENEGERLRERWRLMESQKAASAEA